MSTSALDTQYAPAPAIGLLLAMLDMLMTLPLLLVNCGMAVCRPQEALQHSAADAPALSW